MVRGVIVEVGRIVVLVAELAERGLDVDVVCRVLVVAGGVAVEIVVVAMVVDIATGMDVVGDVVDGYVVVVSVVDGLVAVIGHAEI